MARQTRTAPVSCGGALGPCLPGGGAVRAESSTIFLDSYSKFASLSQETVFIGSAADDGRPAILVQIPVSLSRLRPNRGVQNAVTQWELVLLVRWRLFDLNQVRYNGNNELSVFFTEPLRLSLILIE